MVKLKKILVAYDGSEDGLKALDTAKELTIANEAQLTILYVHEASSKEPVYIDSTQDGENFMVHHYIGPGVLSNNKPSGRAVLDNEIPNRIMSNAKSKMKGMNGITYENLTGSKPAQKIVEYATTYEMDLIIIGNRGISGLKKLVMGSVSQKVIDDSSCSVFLVK